MVWTAAKNCGECRPKVQKSGEREREWLGEAPDGGECLSAVELLQHVFCRVSPVAYSVDTVEVTETHWNLILIYSESTNKLYCMCYHCQMVLSEVTSKNIPRQMWKTNKHCKINFIASVWLQPTLQCDSCFFSELYAVIPSLDNRAILCRWGAKAIPGAQCGWIQVHQKQLSLTDPDPDSEGTLPETDVL